MAFLFLSISKMKNSFLVIIFLFSFLLNAYSIQLGIYYEKIISNISVLSIPTASVDILAIGATPDSVTDCKPFFDAALKMASTSKKGLRIIIPKGIYLINGPLHLVNNVCLDFEEGARLKFSGVPSHFLPAVKTSWEGTFVYNYSQIGRASCRERV